MPAKSHKVIAPNAPQTHAEKFHFAQKKRRIPVSIAVCRALPFVKCRLLLSFFCILPTAFLAEFCTAKCVCATCQWLHYNKIPQKNGGYSLVSPFVLHCLMCSNYFVLSCLFFSILSFRLSFSHLVSSISAFRNPFVLHNSLVTNVPKPFYRVYKSRVSLGNCKITLAISERNAKRLQKEIYYSTLKT